MAQTSDTIKKALSCLQAGQSAEAERLFKKALRQQPRNVAALNLLGVLCASQRRLADAEKYLKTSIAIDPSSDSTFYNYGVVLKGLGRPRDAIDQFTRALAINSGVAETWNNRGTALNDDFQPAAALADFDKATALRPDYAEAYSNKANSLSSLRRFDEARAHYEKALATNPRLAETWAGLGRLLFEMNDQDGAKRAFDRALDINSALAEAWLGRGHVLVAVRRQREALADFAAAQARSPELAEAHFAEACCRLAQGDAVGWEKYEWRWKIKDRPPGAAGRFKRPLWLGDRTAAGRTVLLHAEQGFGDTLQFCRFAPMVAAAGGTVVLEVQPALTTLLTGLSSVERVIAAGDPLPPFDLHCPLGSLPLALRIEAAGCGGGPYLHAADALIETWRQRLPARGRPRIGIAWAGNPRFGSDHNRSIGLGAMLPLLTAIDADIIPLQKEFREGDAALLATHRIEQVAQHLDDFADTAALVSCLDLVITSDTSVAHLAGALGCRTWILLSHAPDWRWRPDGSTSDWYDSATLFRQAAPGDWDELVGRVAAELRRTFGTA